MAQLPQVNQNGVWQNAMERVKQLDDFYRSSPTAQLLIANAPMILQQCQEIRSTAMQQQAALEALAVNRQYDLEEFKIVANDMMENLKAIRLEISSLQQSVRNLASIVAGNPNAKTIIDYTNNQISQNIRMFNNLAYLLLNR